VIVSRNTSAAVIVLLHELATRERVRIGLAGASRVYVCRDQDELIDALARRPYALAVLAPVDARGAPRAPLVERLRRMHPSLPITVVCDLSLDACREIVSLTRAGVTNVLFEGAEDIGRALRAEVASARVRSVADEVLDVLGSRLARDAETLLHQCVEHGCRARTVEELALSIGVHRRTVFNRLAALGLPAPRQLLAWCRLFVAARALEDPSPSVARVAAIYGFGSSAGLCNMLRRHAGLTSEELRARGGLACLLELFAERFLARGATRIA
jgi:AraC-like DNA-binding protein